NLTSETKVGVDYVTAAGAAVVNGSLATRYAYDALDRQVSVTNALNQVTNTYYDELGRVSAVSRQLTATTAQLTEFKRDVHGNALLRIDYAQAATTASGGSVTVAPTAVGAGDPANRVTATSFDVNGRAIRVLDAEQYANRADAKATFSSYDRYGHLVRQWRTVTDAGVARTAWQLNAYDALGRLLWSQSPGNLNLVDNTTAPDTRKVNFYNAFGEVTQTRLVMPATEANDQGIQLGLTKYDLAGHAWFSNAADGIDTVFLYDAQGNVTAQIRSTNADPHAHPLQAVANAMGALALAGLERTDNQYDLLGRLVDSRLASEQNSVLRWQNGAWVKSTMGYNESVADGMIVIGRRDDTGKNFTVRYRLKPDGAWVNAGGGRVQTVDGYPAFSTGGLASGDYEYQVLAQPANETQYLASTGALHIDAGTSAEKDRQVVALYMLLLGRTPAAPELNYWVGAFNDGATLASIAGAIYVDKEATLYRAGGNANAVRLLFQNAGRPQPADADYNANLAAWTARLDQAGATTEGPLRTAAIGQVLGALVFASLPAVALRVSAVTNYLVRGGSDQSVVDRLLATAGSAPDGAIADGTRAAQLESQRRQLARLYLGLFSRAPDQGGFEFWAAALAAGTTIESVALDMLKSPESLAADVLPDSLGSDQYNDKFVTLAYTNLMGRAPTSAELADAKAGLGAPRSAAHAAFLVKLGSRVAGDITDGAPVDPAARTLLFQKTTVALAYAAMPSQGTDIEQLVAVNKAVIAAMGSADSAAAAAHQATLYLQTRALAAKAALDAAVPAAAATPLETLRLQLARVYAVVLNRAPDSGGYAFW
ncbi:MAG TPA: DUF4214 domain-containing protein, partial [Duganella sp.]|uniref:DUF4214 domain-containing protein n=1 Tax=Duganella sp. TaxID=1904440 RepID=UPI002ED50FCF